MAAPGPGERRHPEPEVPEKQLTVATRPSCRISLAWSSMMTWPAPTSTASLASCLISRGSRRSSCYGLRRRIHRYILARRRSDPPPDRKCDPRLVTAPDRAEIGSMSHLMTPEAARRGTTKGGVMVW
ncbi:hypothetical protein PR202_ga31219 [Eleusine coracana subsp. coracana]|uniref:Uncharacterized protein n=1 Tax=Eleusine coracana subsp. coracana TaxID=191504 RepID=A0AAV5DRL7_ELECO|nr:hypothetical protein PR202_ga31219 [Eleusine coracana subsp. coracana]